MLLLPGWVRLWDSAGTLTLQCSVECYPEDTSEHASSGHLTMLVAGGDRPFAAGKIENRQAQPGLLNLSGEPGENGPDDPGDFSFRKVGPAVPAIFD